MHFSVVVSLLLLATSSFVSAVYQPSAADLQANDLRVLQYALILEQLEFSFYSQFQARFTASDFVNAGLGLTANDFTYFNLIRDHERAHVFFLNTTAGVPSATTSCTYNFPVNNVADYIQLAQVLENTGVSAYDGAINNIYNPGTQQAAATIATVEARHASYLNKINSQIPFPSAFDTALNSSTIYEIVFENLLPNGKPLADCDFVDGYLLPTVLYVYPVQNASDSSQPTPQALTANDVTVLQYALFLEHLEAAFYAYVVAQFNASQFAAVYGSNQSYQYVQLIGQHETTHVNALTSTIQNYGATPISDCTYNFASAINNSVTNAIAIAAALEATGVGAYDGAVNAINDPTLKQIAATIATVEARHASYINLLYGNSGSGPVQGAGGPFDAPYTYNQTVGIVMNTNLIASCPAFPGPYQILLVKPYTNSTFNPASTAGTTGTTGSASTTAAGTTGSASTTAAGTTGSASTTAAGTTGASTTGASTTTGTVAPTPTPTATPTATPAPTPAPTRAPTPTPTPAASTTGTTPTPTPTPAATTGATPTPTPTPTSRATTGSTTARSSTTSGASIASASVVVALLVAVAAF